MDRFRPTTSPKPSTKRWFGFEVGDYYYYGGGPESGWEMKPDYFFKEDTKEKVIKQTDIIDQIVSIIGIILNIVHFIILTRKELRSNVVFIIILGICVCDIMVCTGNITERYVKGSEEKGMNGGFCGTDEQWWMVFFEACSQGIQKLGRLNSALFALSTAAIRTITVLFPMSSVADRLMRIKSGILIVLVDSIFCAIFYSIYYSLINIFRNGASDASCFTLSGPTFNRVLVIQLEGYCVLALTLIYFLVTIILLNSLLLARRNSRKLKNDKSGGNSTSSLVTVMAISFLISNGIYSLTFILDSRLSLSQDLVVIQLVDMFIYASRTILTCNSIFHCLICFFLSSQYRETVKRLIRWSKISKIPVFEPSTSSAMVGTANTSSVQ